MKFKQKKIDLVEKILLISTLILTIEFCLPHIAIAQDRPPQNSMRLGPTQIIYSASAEEKASLNQDENLLKNKKPKVVRWVTITAYSSNVDQCDSTPFITANGKWVYDGLVAANFLRFGTKIKIPEMFGDKVFTVDDRMNKKYNSRVDIWMPNREMAKEFGVRYLKIEVY